MKESWRYNVSVLINHHQDFKKWWYQVLMDQRWMFNKIQGRSLDIWLCWFILNLSWFAGVFLSVMAANEEKEGCEDLRYLLNFNFILFEFCMASLLRGMSSWTIWEQSFLLNKVLKCTSRFRGSLCFENFITSRIFSIIDFIFLFDFYPIS